MQHFHYWLTFAALPFIIHSNTSHVSKWAKVAAGFTWKFANRSQATISSKRKKKNEKHIKIRKKYNYKDKSIRIMDHIWNSIQFVSFFLFEYVIRVRFSFSLIFFPIDSNEWHYFMLVLIHTPIDRIYGMRTSAFHTFFIHLPMCESMQVFVSPLPHKRYGIYSPQFFRYA